MKYYVYALINPEENNTPFYIGMGQYERLKGHFGEARRSIGADPEAVVTHAKNADIKDNQRIDIINKLINNNYRSEDIARIIAENLDEDAAFALEAFLIKSAYGIENLTNINNGRYPDRYREKNKLTTFTEDFDFKDSMPPQFTDDKGISCKHYVYSLIDPDTSEPFYIGKGKEKRVWQHFTEARNSEKKSDKVERIRTLLDNGHAVNDIARIMAYVESDDVAFKLESLLIKFVYGEKSLTNDQGGHERLSYRAKNEWMLMEGFDKPFIYKAYTAGNRTWILDRMTGEGLGDVLFEIKNRFSKTLQFDEPELLDSRDLSLRAEFIVGEKAVAHIKVFTRVINEVQVEVRFPLVNQKKWAENHFFNKLCYVNRRADYVFFPDKWANNLATGIEESCDRVTQIVKILRAESADQIKDLSCLLEQTIKTPNRQQKERFVTIKRKLN
jgi:hypothetical protein